MSYFQYKDHVTTKRRRNLYLSSNFIIRQLLWRPDIQILLIIKQDILQKRQFLDIRLKQSRTKLKEKKNKVKVKLQCKLKHLFIKEKESSEKEVRSQQEKMFVVQALFPFSALTLKQQESKQKEQKPLQKDEKHERQEILQRNHVQHQRKQDLQVERQVHEDEDNPHVGKQKQQAGQITYLSFETGDKILVEQAYENGWLYGNTLKQPSTKGFFPSNYVQTATKPKPPPPPPSQPLPSDENDNQVFDPNQSQGVDWVQNELSKIIQGPVKSDYYLGIKGYKNVKIDEKNQNILKGDHVKYDVSTGLAKVPVKDQAPAAKAVRQMGYYFDYHQWVEQRNKHPQQKSRPDPKKKKIKKLNLKGMK